MNSPSTLKHSFEYNFLALPYTCPRNLSSFSVPPTGYIEVRVNKWLDNLYRSVATMPNPSKQGKSPYAQTTFVNIRLTDDQKKEFDGWSKEQGEELASTIAICMANNGKLSVSWDAQNACFIASLTCKDEKSVNMDHCITSRSSDWFEALTLTVFKIDVILKDKPWSSAVQASNWG